MDEVFEIGFTNNHNDDSSLDDSDDLEIDLFSNHSDSDFGDSSDSGMVSSNSDMAGDINSLDLDSSGVPLIIDTKKKKLQIKKMRKREKDHNSNLRKLVLKHVRKPGKGWYFIDWSQSS